MAHLRTLAFLFRNAPIEFRILVPASLGILLLSTILFLLFPIPSNVASLSDIFSIIIAGSKYLLMAMAPALVLGLFCDIFPLLRSSSDKKRVLTDIGISMLYLIGIILLPLVAMGSISMFLFFHVSSDRVIDTTEMIMRLEYSLFRTFPAFTVQNYPIWFERVLTNAYNGLFVVWGLTFTLTFLFSRKQFRMFLLSFFIFFGIAFINWVLVPVLNPGPMLYLHDAYNYRFPGEIEQYALEFRPSDYLSPYVYTLRNHMFVPGGHTLVVTAFPSPHAAWTFMAVYFLIALFPLMSVVAVPYLVAVVISTFYMLQHYALDAVWGVLLGALSIRITHLILERDKTADQRFFSLLSSANICMSSMQKRARNFTARFFKIS